MSPSNPYCLNSAAAEPPACPAPMMRTRVMTAEPETPVPTFFILVPKRRRLKRLLHARDDVPVAHKAEPYSLAIKSMSAIRHRWFSAKAWNVYRLSLREPGAQIIGFSREGHADEGDAFGAPPGPALEGQARGCRVHAQD